MNNGLIAVRYATALLGYANQSKLQDRIYTEAKAITQSFSQFSTLRAALENPVLPNLEKRKLLLLAAGGEVSSNFERFIDLLLDNNREIYVQSIMLKFVDLYRKQNNIHSGKLTTATTVAAATEKRLISMMEKQTGGTIEIEKLVDPSILGGFMFEVDFVRWNASLSSQLQRIKVDYIEKNKRVL
jgi:F-type H+-transporting ATPase subunit delta